MRKIFAVVGLAAALGCPSVAFAVSGTSSSYGTNGVGARVPTQSPTPFQRSWNHANQSKYQAYAGANWVRRHHRYPW